MPLSRVGKETGLYTIGHSNHPMPVFLDLLTAHGVEVVVDVRSFPRSRYYPQFNEPLLRKAVQHSGIKYINLGKELGGRPKALSFL